MTTVYFADGDSAESDLDPDILWALCLANAKGYATSTISVQSGTRRTNVEVRLIDFRKTFGRILVGSHESYPPTS
ncbi:hypothetical protein A2635_05295 [Candidatus Peribacteria bacterium RIFCSPHIGHO2_01_FULL_51_9]|nr:MAG: hypothetical protein A2635_05295 [Candidatus Peribacteria bacterium RIFCSPHIGHO2_01_FULL_51_9]